MKSAGKARSNGLYRHIRTSKEIIRNLLNDYEKFLNQYIRCEMTRISQQECRVILEFRKGHKNGTITTRSNYALQRY